MAENKHIRSSGDISANTIHTVNQAGVINQYCYHDDAGPATLLRNAIAPDAAFNSYERHKGRPSVPKCASGTRREVLGHIASWISNCNNEEPILWVNGHAGVGKSAIAQTIAEERAERGFMASFFFSRADIERSSSRRLFPTIASQLCNSSQQLQSAIHRALHLDPSVLDRVLRDQLQKLIITPLLTLKEPLSPVPLVIIDALDECDDPQLVIKLFAEALVQHTGLLKIIFTSRPAVKIQDAFYIHAHSVTHILSLNEFETTGDIRHFLTHRFDEIYREHHRVMRTIPPPWPSRDIFDKIARDASDLFIYAATILQFIDRPDPSCNPSRLLTKLLGGQSVLNLELSPLDKLYTQVLSTVPRDDEEHLHIVLGTILLLFNPLSLNDLQNLLHPCLEPDEVVAVLLPLYSILHISENEALPIRIYHESVYDFLTDIRRSEKYFIDRIHHHADITRHCFKLMFKELKPGVGDPSKFNDEISDNNRNEHINGSLRYACRFWARHLSEATGANVLECLQNFMFKFLLHWIKVLSLLGDLRFAIPSLRDATKWTKDHHKEQTELLDILNDAERFVVAFFDVVSSTPLHVYYSLLFTPEDTRLRHVYSDQLPTSVRVVGDLQKSWDRCLHIIHCTAEVKSVAFSPNGTYVASGSDEITQVWDAVTGSLFATLEPTGVVKANGVYWQGKVTSVAFAPNNSALIACGYSQGHIRLWNIKTDELSLIRSGRGVSVFSVAWSPDGTRLFCEVEPLLTARFEVWNVEPPQLISSSDTPTFARSLIHASLQAKTNNVASLPPWQAAVVTALDGGWEARTGKCTESGTQLQHGDSVTFFLHLTEEEAVYSYWRFWFLPDKPYIAGAAHNFFGVWDTITGRKLCNLDGHRGVSSVQFSPRDALMLSGSKDKTIRVWDVSTFNLTGQLPAQRTTLESSYTVTFSPRRILFSGKYTDVSIWDINTGSFLESISNHRTHRCLAISPNGTHAGIQISAPNCPLYPDTIEIWDISSQKQLLSSFTVPRNHDCPLSFSSDARLIAIGSRASIDIRLVATGDKVRTWDVSSLSNHWTVDLHRIIFSPRGTTIAWVYMATERNFAEPEFTCTTGTSYHRLGRMGMIDNNKGMMKGKNVVHPSKQECVSLMTFALRNVDDDSLPPRRIIEPLGTKRNRDLGSANVVFSPDDVLVALGVGGGVIALYNAINMECLAMFEGLGEAAWPLKFQSSGTSDIYLTSAAGTHDLSSYSIPPDTVSAICATRQRHYHVRHDGWVWDGNRRVCWIPMNYRPAPTWKSCSSQASDGHKLAIMTNKGTLLILDFSRVLSM